MGHTYTLTNDGFVSPSYMRHRPKIVVRVTHSRKITLENEGMHLVLLDQEPDLPMGKEVKVWLERWFKCETLESLNEKAAIANQKAADNEERSKGVLTDAVKTYLHPVTALLATSLSKNEVASLFCELRSAQKQHLATYKRYWGAYDPAMKSKSNDALAVSGVISESIQKLSQAVFAQLAKHGVAGKVAYAYSPNEGANAGIYSPGKYHFIIDTSIRNGRLVRNAGETLCKPARGFWGLEVINQGDNVSCHSCQDLMVKLMTSTIVAPEKEK